MASPEETELEEQFFSTTSDKNNFNFGDSDLYDTEDTIASFEDAQASVVDHEDESKDKVTWTTSQHLSEQHQNSSNISQVSTEGQRGPKWKQQPKLAKISSAGRRSKAKLKSTTSSVKHQLQDVVTHPKERYQSRRQNQREQKGKRKPLKLCEELDKFEKSTPGSSSNSSGNLSLPASESKMPLGSHPSSAAESYPLKQIKSTVKKSLGKSHPKRITKSAASQALSSHVLGFDLDPFRLTKDDVEFIKLCNKKRFEKDGKLITEHEQRLQELKIARRKMLVNWVSDRHMESAAVVRGGAIRFPELQSLPTPTRRVYLQWLGDTALYLTQRFIPLYTSPWKEPPPYNRKKTMSNVERVAIGVAPFQEWVMMVRAVYRWEDPVKTARWLGTYILLWKYQYLITFVYVYIISRVLRSRQDGNRVERVTTSINRARDSQQNIHRLSELIERHGSDGWVDALPDNFGAWGQMKLGDVADLLEVIRNFYKWTNPQQTVYSLVFFGVCILTSILTDMEYCWRIITFVFGFWFFVSCPVASRWPRYRWVISPFKWMFWGVPTHSELAYTEFREDAIRSLNDPDGKKKSARRRARRRNMADYEGPVMVIDDDDEDEGYVTNSPEMEDEEENDPEELISPHIPHDPESLAGRIPQAAIFCAFRCVHREHPGKMFISDYGILFETELRKKLTVEIQWRDITTVSKKEALSMGKMGKVHSLVIELIDGEEVVFNAMANRDKAFNRIIGFSGLQWKSGL